MPRFASALLATLAAAAGAAAGEVEGVVRATVGGTAKADASGVVVFVADVKLTLEPTDAQMVQRQQQFVPQLLVVPIGTRVSFPNHDFYEHNVFSRSPHATFDLGRYGEGGGKSHTFDEPGVVDVYCNVHPQMIGHIVVVPGPFAVTDRNGRFAIEGVPAGKHQLVIWDRTGLPTVQRREIDVPAGALELEVQEAEAEPPHPNKFGGVYRSGGY